MCKAGRSSHCSEPPEMASCPKWMTSASNLSGITGKFYVEALRPGLLFTRAECMVAAMAKAPRKHGERGRRSREEAEAEGPDEARGTSNCSHPVAYESRIARVCTRYLLTCKSPQESQCAGGSRQGADPHQEDCKRSNCG